MLARRVSAPALARVALALAAFAVATRADAALPVRVAVSLQRRSGVRDRRAARGPVRGHVLRDQHRHEREGRGDARAGGVRGSGQDADLVRVLGNMHGDEPVGRGSCASPSWCGRPGPAAVARSQIITRAEPGDERFLETAAYLARNARLFFAPTLNPDGFASAADSVAVDLNRDWPDQYDGSN